MPFIAVCPLSRLNETVEAHDASHVVTLINGAKAVARPSSIPEERHLFVKVSDIVDPLDGHVHPAEEHVARLLGFVTEWGGARERALVIHCWAGISRSTAAAYITACALTPARCERAAASALRAASPTATPNRRLVALADALLGRGGRMVEAVAAIGRGADAFEGRPFTLALD